MQTIRFAFAAFVAVALIPASAAAWECTFMNCPVQCDLPITYAIGELPADVDETEGIDAIRRAFDDWNEPTCVDFQFEYLGRLADLTGSAAVVVGVVPWSMQLGGPNSWAIALSSAGQDGCYAPSMSPNIALNDDDWAWSTDGSADFVSTADLYTTVLGRIGTHLGIANSQSADTVVLSTTTMVLDGIGSADEDAVCWLYADGVVAPGNAPPVEIPATCTECTADADCGTDEVCLALFGENGSVCVLTCDAEAPMCVGDGECFEIAGADSAYCLTFDEDSRASCPDTGAEPGGDMGVPAADMGEPVDDMGTSDEPDSGSTATGADMGSANGVDDSTVGGGGCSTAGAMPLGSGMLLVLALFVRRRRD